MAKQQKVLKNAFANIHMIIKQERHICTYGIENFDVVVVEETNDPDMREKHWISTLKKYHSQKDKSSYATYGMKGKKQSQHFVQSIKKANCCPVMCEGTRYDSVGKAQEAYPGISIRKRLDSSKYPQFYRLRDKTLRK